MSLVLAAFPARAQHIDPHALYEEKCAKCHEPHAGEYVSKDLEIADGSVVGKKTGRPVVQTLETGHGRLSATEVTVMTEFLTRIASSDRLFLKKCRICHSNAKELARLDLVIRNDRLWGRYTGRDIAQFLENHGRLTPDEVTKMINVLKWQILTATPKPE